MPCAVAGLQLGRPVHVCRCAATVDGPSTSAPAVVSKSSTKGRVMDKMQKLRARQKGQHGKRPALSTGQVVDQQQWQEQQRLERQPPSQGQDQQQHTHQEQVEEEKQKEQASPHGTQQQEQHQQHQLHLLGEGEATPQEREATPQEGDAKPQDGDATPEGEQQQQLGQQPQQQLQPWPGRWQSSGPTPQFSDWQQYCNCMVNSDLLIHRHRGEQATAGVSAKLCRCYLQVHSCGNR